MPPVTVADSLSTQKPDREKLGLEHTREFVARVFGPDLHALRVLSLANGVAGVLNAAVLSIHAIGQAYANVAKIAAKSGVKQVDRMLGNDALSLDIVLARWVRFVVGENASILIALDWTDFDKDDHTTLCAYMVTTHGRAMPLAWKTVKKSALKDQRTGHELEMVERLHTWLPENVNITLLADRAFGYQELYALLEAFGWNFVIRFRGCILVESAEGAVRPAEDWVPSNGRPKLLVGARVTDKRAAVGAVVLVKAARMKEAWCLATSLATTKAAEVVKLYGRRFTIEETFRDTKDLHLGMGLSATNIRDAARRDRLLLLVAMAHTLLTLLGAASEASGLDRTLKVNTVKKRTHSLYRQGLYWYHCIPTMREEWLRRLVDAFDRIVREHAFFSHFFEVK
ncbi:IS4 family transposase [Sorangium sp. So ce1036]|uniref:IS4 family transposase n=1 Tax=Sorangium sp. So ce1036 TaxID=3133328 RepID=UPI003F51FDB6